MTSATACRRAGRKESFTHNITRRVGAWRRSSAGVSATGSSGRMSSSRSRSPTRSASRSRMPRQARCRPGPDELRTAFSTVGRRAPAARGPEPGRWWCRACPAKSQGTPGRIAGAWNACYPCGGVMGARSEQLFSRARELIPGGVNSPVRSWRSVGGDPVFIARAAGASITDTDGQTYVDFVGSWGPMILGHAHPDVVSAIAAQTASGTSFGAPTALEVELAELVTEAMPSVEQVRLVSSGTEATMSALRLARAATGRDAIVKFTGCYHGHVDALLVRAGSGALTLGVPDSPGVPAPLVGLTHLAEFNDASGVRTLLRERGHEIAAVIVEP